MKAAALQILTTALLASGFLGCGSEPADRPGRGLLPGAPPAESAHAPESQPDNPAEPDPDKAGNHADPTYGLPLEYHFDPPPVPERIQGPTPPIADKST
jgi:hypothetical protein